MNLTLNLIKHCFEIPEALELLDQAIDSSIRSLNFDFDYYHYSIMEVFIKHGRFDVFKDYKDEAIIYLSVGDGADLAIQIINYFNLDINNYVIDLIKNDIEYGKNNHEPIKPYITDEHLEDIKDLLMLSIHNDCTHWLYLMDNVEETLLECILTGYRFPRNCIQYYGQSLSNYIDKLIDVCADLQDDEVEIIYTAIGYDDKLLTKLRPWTKENILENTKEEKDKYFAKFNKKKSARSV